MKRFFDTELETLRSDLFRMGETVMAHLQAALRAYADSDAEVAQQVIAGDDIVDQLEVRIDEEAIRYMNLRAPVATELRVLITAMKAGHELERAGDEVTKIARRLRHLSNQPRLKLDVDLVRMGEIAIEMLRAALECLVAGTEEKALAICQRDSEVDEMNREVSQHLTQLMTRDSSTVSRAVDLIFIAKAIERIADHATNIAEDTIFLTAARDVRHTPEVKHTPNGGASG
jgi:phosphate transport system protein